ncbi:MAG: hypothetical protein IIX57_04540, partial [Lachnospiraceae bacterium]|nr:hypothetical protein [Lachnospiraceae bacterium]
NEVRDCKTELLSGIEWRAILLGRLKFALLKWLLDDICVNSVCKDCQLSSEIEIAGYVGTACGEEDIFIQARKAWGLEK